MRIAALDAASGAGEDSQALAVVEADGERIRLCLLREWRPPFDALAVAGETRKLLDAERVPRRLVWCDAYGLGLVASILRGVGVAAAKVPLDTSQTLGAFRALAPRVALGDGLGRELRQQLRRQMERLIVRPRQGGRESIDHPSGEHDDLAVAVARAAVMLDRCGGERGRLGARPYRPTAAPAALTLDEVSRLEAPAGSWL